MRLTKEQRDARKRIATIDELVPRYLPGEREAIDIVKKLGDQFGFGNLIHQLRDAWADTMKEKYDFDQSSADRVAGHICVWCGVDHRTGKKYKP